MYQHSTTLTTKSGFQGTKKYNKLYGKIHSGSYQGDKDTGRMSSI